MADFLSRLAARALGEARVARPIISPVFAPVAGLGGPVPAEPVEQLEEITAPTPAARPTENRATRSGDDHLLIPRGQPEVAGEASLEREPLKLPDDQANPNRPAQEQEAARAARGEQRTGTGELLIDRHSIRPPETRDEAAPSEPRRLVSPLVHRAPEAVPVAALGRHNPGPLEIAARRPSPPAHSAVHESRTGESPEPVIRVTIGRVEVRAVFPPAAQAPAPKARTVSALSLEEYLRQRRGGQR